jgi:epoxide hydrolase-like predicted phosphatase
VRVEAILFDVGGVLVAAGEPVQRRRWERKLGLAPQALDAALAGAIRAGWKGGRTETEIWRRLQDALGLADDEFAVLREDLYAHEYLEPAFADFLDRARSEYRLAVITNNGPGARADLQGRFQLCDRVDAFVVSAEVGIEKPDPRIYELAASLLGVAPWNCLFVDDDATNVGGAEAVGMTGIVHRTARETLAQLETLLTAA